MTRKGLLFLLLVCLLWPVGISHSQTLTWHKSQLDAVNAVQGDMKILLLAGRSDESNTLYMRDTVLRDQDVVEVIDSNFVTWFCDVHTSNEWVPYSEGLTQITLPLICCIDPDSLQGYVGRITGAHLPEEFVTWLEGFLPGDPVPPPPPPGYGGGNGTEAAPFVLQTAEDIEQLANYPDHWGKHFAMADDIDMESNLLVSPIGNAATPFTGTLEGNGFCIRNLIFEDTAGAGPVGLFGWVAGPGTIRNLRLIAPVVTTDKDVAVGALVGYVDVYSIVWRCSVEGGFINAPASSYPAGGLIGMNLGRVDQCYSTAAVAGWSPCGGLIGRNEATATVQDCAAAGAVTAWSSSAAAGGLIGNHAGGQVTHCLGNSPSIRGATAGGLIGARTYGSPSLCDGCVCNLVVGRATGNWMDEPGDAWCEPLANLSNSAIFWTCLWDFKDVWYMKEVPRLQWLNGPPVAVARGPADILRPSDLLGGSAEVVLDGTDSSDPQGDALTCAWTCFEVIDGVRQSPGTLLGTNAVQVAYLEVGAYEIDLVVDDGLEESAPATVSVTVNSAPIAAATGPNGALKPTENITMDGTDSSDPDGDPLTYTWICFQSNGSPLSGLSIPAISRPTFRLPAGKHTVTLTVSDGIENSTPTSVPLTVNTPPVAVASGPETVVPVDGLGVITLDATGSSDSDGDALTYAWTCYRHLDGQWAQMPATTVPSKARPTFALPVGQYKIDLVVHDGTMSSPPATLSLSVNSAPTADAGDDIQVYDDGTERQQITLDGSGSSDPDPGQSLSYLWDCATSDPDTASEMIATLSFPVGAHEVQLFVTDALGATDPDTVQVTVEPALTAATGAASPSMVGRESQVQDVKLYLLLPTNHRVSDVDTTAPINLLVAGNRLPLVPDTDYGHKKRTVVATANRAELLASVGPDNGPASARISVPLNTGQYVCADVTLEVIAGRGPAPFEVALERTLGYYLNDNPWR